MAHKIIWNANGSSYLEQHQRDAVENILADAMENDARLRPLALGKVNIGRLFLDATGNVWCDTQEPGGSPRAFGYVADVVLDPIVSPN